LKPFEPELLRVRALALIRVETKTVFSVFAKSENDAKMSKFSFFS
jgi:hypothetical protein